MINPIRPHLDFAVSPTPQDGKMNVSFFVERPPTQIFMSHGIADKNWRNENNVRAFDYVCVSGPFWQEKYKGLPSARILVVGYPKLDPIFQGEYQRKPGPKRVLWAPTHRAVRAASSDPRFEQYLSKIPYQVIRSPHPATGGHEPTLQALVDADVVITDFSSMIYEAWALNKPVVFPDWLVKEGVLRFKGSLEAHIYQQGIGLHASCFEELVNLLDGPLDSEAKAIAEQVFPKALRGCSGKMVADLFNSL